MKTMNQRITKPRKAAAEPVPLPAPAITPYQKIAAQLSAAINDTVVQIPGYNDDLSNIAKHLRRRVRPEFVGMTVAAVDASPELQGVNQLDTTDCRDTQQFSQAFQPMADLFLSVGRRMALLIRVREVKSGRSALSIYNIAKRLALNPNNTHVAVHVANLRAELRRKRIARQATPPAPAASHSAEGGATT